MYIKSVFLFNFDMLSPKHTMSQAYIYFLMTSLLLQFLLVTNSFQFTRSSFVAPPLRISARSGTNCRFSLSETKKRAAIAPVMFLDGFKNYNSQDNKRSKNDTTNLGNLIVPTVGVGTISWSSKSCK
jgi:hypothetical protein